MGYPEPDYDEPIILKSRSVRYKSISFDAILTSRCIYLTASKNNVIPSQEINLSSIRNVRTEENALRDHFLLLSLVTDSGEKHQAVLTFARQAGVERKRECNEWAKKLMSLISPSTPVISPSDVPALDSRPSTKRDVLVPAKGTATITRPAKKNIEIAHQTETIFEKSSVAAEPKETLSHATGSFCSQCGIRVPLKSTFCNQCGNPIKSPSGSVPETLPRESAASMSVQPSELKPDSAKTPERQQPPAPKPVVRKHQEMVQHPTPAQGDSKERKSGKPPLPEPGSVKKPETIQPRTSNPVLTREQATKQVLPPTPQPVAPKVQEPVQLPVPKPVAPKVQEPVQLPVPKPVAPKVQEPVQPPVPQSVVPEVQEPVQPPADSTGELQVSSIGLIIPSLEPGSKDAIPLARQQSELASKVSQEAPSPQVVWPVFSPAESPAVPAKDARASPASPPPPMVPVHEGKKPNYLAIGILIMAILPILAGLVIVANIMAGPAVGPANTTPEILVPTTLQALLPQTTITPRVTVPLAPGSTQVMIPPTGVWVRVSYPGTYIGLIGSTGNQTEVTDTGDHLYQIPVTERTVTAALQKNDSSGDQIILEVYKNGVILKRETSISPKGIVEIQLDLKTL